MLLVTGGDDGALAFTLLPQPCVRQPLAHPTRPPSPSILLLPAAHASAITAVAHLGPPPSAPLATSSIHNSPTTTSTNPPHPSIHRFATSGNDQRLKTWLVTINVQHQQPTGAPPHLEIKKQANVHTSVADLSCMGYYSDCEGEEEEGEGGRIVVAGIGMESFRV